MVVCSKGGVLESSNARSHWLRTFRKQIHWTVNFFTEDNIIHVFNIIIQCSGLGKELWLVLTTGCLQLLRKTLKIISNDLSNLTRVCNTETSHSKRFWELAARLRNWRRNRWSDNATANHKSELYVKKVAVMTSYINMSLRSSSGKIMSCFNLFWKKRAHSLVKSFTT